MFWIILLAIIAMVLVPISLRQPRKPRAEKYPRTIVAAPYIWRGNQKGGHN